MLQTGDLISCCGLYGKSSVLLKVLHSEASGDYFTVVRSSSQPKGAASGGVMETHFQVCGCPFFYFNPSVPEFCFASIFEMWPKIGSCRLPTHRRRGSWEISPMIPFFSERKFGQTFHIGNTGHWRVNIFYIFYLFIFFVIRKILQGVCGVPSLQFFFRLLSFGILFINISLIFSL